ncbi:NAD(P)H-binding protein [Streptomyces actinomycinicus]|uniref:NAD(P)H-binding protein n=1 Tax=Streptomyces actinomycinicus TaxID=1695166 RepID=A0A937JPP2_9ACTN|nr:NAD(P)H-binding protein [Streptomyces actinomycinicus]MBL1083667.1 NAD(P)H-binding protein [Streptomyces actinomycinicus]
MKIVIAGGHGRIARRLGRLLTVRGDSVVGLIRNPAHGDDLSHDGIRPVVCDLEAASSADVVAALSGADAVVFAAGAGPGSGAARKYTVDHQAAVLLAEAAGQAGIRRYVMVSTRGAGSPPPAHADEVWTAYVHAKTAADDHVMAQDLDWTILRPAALTDDPGTGGVRLTAERSVGQVTRDDVAEVLAALLATPATAGLVLELAQGPDPVSRAVARAADNRTGEPCR